MSCNINLIINSRKSIPFNIGFYFLLLLIISLSGCGTVAEPMPPDPNEEFKIPPENIPSMINRANSGDKDACWKLYRYYLYVENSVPKILPFLRILAKSGDPDAQFALYSHLTSPGENSDIEEGVFWLLESAKSGGYSAQSELAARYEDGKILGKDCSKSMYWYEIVANNQADTFAMIRMADFYISGECCKKDYSTALAWLIVAESYFTNHPYLEKLHLKMQEIMPSMKKSEIGKAYQKSLKIKEKVMKRPTTYYKR